MQNCLPWIYFFALAAPSVVCLGDPMPGMDHPSMPASSAPTVSPMGAMPMHSSTNVADPMSREASGTSWQPESSPIYARMKMRGRNMLMFHGNIYPRFTRTGGDRDVSAAGQGGRSRFDAPSMFMAMYSHPLDSGPMPKSQLGLRLMMSADPFLERGYGYPLLFQSGESYQSQPLHDRQHPHDLFSEVSATYSQRLSPGQSAYLYLGYPGEPALGPPAFVHRVSGMDFPDAPIAHHWEDATHIQFGVATAGFSFGKWKLEGSYFNGREPDENRYAFDNLRLNSYSGRLSWNPGKNWALQVSNGFIKGPEELRPDENQRRTTASAIYNKPLGEDANWASTFVWGQNNTTGEGRSNAYTFESALQRRKNTIFMRAEYVQKSGEELALPAPDDTRLFGVRALSAGYVRDLKRGSGLDVGLGAQVTVSDNPSHLDAYYGSGPHTGFQIFLRIRPSRLKMPSSPAAGMPGMDMR